MDTFFDRKQLIVGVLLVGLFEISVVVVRLIGQMH
jgi:Sec-independent protein secretion pathway component TatC